MQADSPTADGGYVFDDAGSSPSHAYLWPSLVRLLERHGQAATALFELGCGNGSTARMLSERGFSVTGVDPSASGMQAARAAYPDLDLHEGSSEDDLAARFGQFPTLVSLEVVEHVYAPRRYLQRVDELLQPGGLAILSTPYHGYWKNLAMAVTGKMDAHFTALWDHGHIKFWSIATLTTLVNERSFDVLEIERVGRIPALAKSMVFAIRKPA